MPSQFKGTIRSQEEGKPVPGVTVNLYTSEEDGQTQIGTAITDENGRYEIKFTDRDYADGHKQIDDPLLLVFDSEGRLLKPTHEITFPITAQICEVNIEVPVRSEQEVSFASRQPQPRVKIGAFSLDAEVFDNLTPDDVLNMARAFVGPVTAFTDLGARSFVAECRSRAKRTLCATETYITILEIVERKKWSDDVLLRINDILTMRESLFVAEEKIYESNNFFFHYYISGDDAVNLDTSEQKVFDPGTENLLVTLPAGGPPIYIKRIAYWLEKALALYTSPPFNMRNPVTGGKIAVFVDKREDGAAMPPTSQTRAHFRVNNKLPPDLVCAIAVHELFHLIQFEYKRFTDGTWYWALLEGGATFAEDLVADVMNRYLDEAGHNFNGIGLLTNPNQPLFENNAKYKSSLFWRYLGEQRSDLGLEVGVDTYRHILEKCSEGTYSSNDLKNAIRSLPWDGDFYEFSYYDFERRYLRSSETVFGNFAVACYLKDLGTGVPDRRFDFLEDGEKIHFVNVIPGQNPQDTLVSVHRKTVRLNNSSPVSLDCRVNNMANRFYEVEVEEDVTNIRIEFITEEFLTSLIFQIVLIEEDNTVRDIYRTDSMNYSKQITNIRDGKRLSKIGLVVSGGHTGGGFTVSLSFAAPAPDVMVARWNSEEKKEYHIDPRNDAWNWTSPDLWINKNGGSEHKIHIRLHNKGNADASGIQVEFEYKPFSAGLIDSEWLPVRDKNGLPQRIMNTSLIAGKSGEWNVPWDPSPFSINDLFLIRASVTVPGDPNIDNKTVLSLSRPALSQALRAKLRSYQ